MNAVADAIVASEALSRREFLRRLQAMGGLLLVADGLRIVKAADAPKYGAEGMEHGTIDNPLVFVMVGDDGWVTIVAHRSEMGQGVRTGMPLIVADEMEADWNKVRVQQAPADEVKYGNQDTDGSRSTRHFIDPMRRCGAAARMMLEQAAALYWSVPVAEVHAANHEVLHGKTGRKLGFGALAKRAAKLKVPPTSALRLKKAEEFRYVGKGKVALIDGHDIVTGQAQYGIDPWFKDMSFAVIARSPVLGGSIKQFDGKAAAAAPGVLKVMQMPAPVAKATFHPLAGVAVIANSTGTAIAARKLLKIDWDDGANGSYDSDAYRAAMQESAHKPGRVVRESGNIDTALKAAANTIEAEYYIPHIAHATMEPPCAVARIVAGKCEVWAPTQAPQATREDVAKYLGISADNVTVHVTLLGGGFGRKSKPDFATEAALLSQSLDGRPVKVTWTREDDLHHDYLHTVSVEYLKAGMDVNGKVSAWLHRSVAPSLATLFNPKADHESGGELGMGFINMPYDIPNLRMENPEASAHCRIGWFRSVSNIPHAFAVQSFVAELAASAHKDHRDYLLELIGPARKIDPNSLQDKWNHGESPQRYPVDTGRLRGVVEKVTQEAGWGKKFAPGHGQGLAAHYSFVSYAAAVVEVDIDDLGRISVPRVDVAFDCGPQVNPERIRSQLEGAVIMGLSLAMFGEITFKNGRAQQDNFHQYRVMRMNEAPSDIRVHLIPYTDWTMPLGGVGEPGIPPIAPALCNAVFAATGKRIRRLPIKDQARRST
ncbi:MAG TPA: molybdopterin cofactor-binding domain-containing protein [Steroidobacteraceae bacterium]|jgi:isoquinoline 1-oxidoreductase beta subunit|nr:molybdopterin cofactor-binding domain-containing protein [Steroidobacteraceae bacterium]